MTQLTVENTASGNGAHGNLPGQLQSPAAPDPVRQELAITYYLSAVKAFESGDSAVALSLLSTALRLNADFYEVHYFLGMIQGCLENFSAAITHLQRAVTINNDSAPAHLLLGKAYCTQGDCQAGIAALRRAHELDPGSIAIICVLSNALAAAGSPAEGEQLLNGFSEIGSKDHLWHFTMAMFTQTDRPDTALFHYQKALAVNPDYHEAGLNYAILLLSLGLFEQGWKAYEHRIPWLGLNRELNLFPRWQGEPLSGKSILVVTEQGFGDSIQFIRYAKLLKEQGATVHVLCSNNLPVRPLIAAAVGVDNTIVPIEPVPHIDWYIPLMSLPLMLGTKLETIPGEPGYFVPDKTKVKNWQERLKQYAGLKVGIVWSGGRGLKADSRRSIPFEVFSTLLGVKGVTFFSLQIGPDALSAEVLAALGGALIDLTALIHDFGDTAALIENIDLVISVDTAVAHVAGALGKPVWTLLYHPPDWRWMRGSDDTPWYPSMRLFRQDATMRWEPVLERIKQQLSLYAANSDL